METVRLLLLLLLVCIFYLINVEGGGMVHLEGLLNKLDEERAPASVQEAAARGVLQRLLPLHSSSFHFEIVSKVGTATTYWKVFFLELMSAMDRMEVTVNCCLNERQSANKGRVPPQLHQNMTVILFK
jgi:hypothetical protein